MIRTRRSFLRSLAVVLGVTILASSSGPVRAFTATDHKSISGITQYFWVSYNEQVCGSGTNNPGSTQWQIYAVSFQYYRSDTTCLLYTSPSPRD